MKETENEARPRTTLQGVQEPDAPQAWRPEAPAAPNGPVLPRVAQSEEQRGAQSPQARPQSPEEERLNALLHGLGVALALAGGAVLVGRATSTAEALKVLSAWVFTTSMVVLYGVSALYHGATDPRWKSGLQRLDRTAIALLMAGTYTPIGLLMVRGVVGQSLCVTEWALAISSVVLALRDPDYARHSVWVYQAMGWLTALGMPAFFKHTPGPDVLALALGGMCYIGGLAFLVRDRLKYFHAIFHVLVLFGTAFQFWAISEYIG